MRNTLFLLAALLCTQVSAQEIRATIKVVAPTLKQTPPAQIEQLEKEIESLINNTVWTDQEFSDEEKIEASIQLNILEEVSASNFRGELIVKSSRPVYKSSYNTAVVNYLDKGISFKYDGVTPLIMTRDGFSDNLSSILSFYMYYIIAMDYDTFSPSGGNPYYDRARNIYNNLPSSLQNSDGWSNTSTRKQNRYWLLENAQNPKLNKYREALYDYHLSGMDIMHDDPAKGRAVLLSAIKTMEEAYQDYNDAIVVRMFLDAKKDEIHDIFTVADKGQRQLVKSVVTSIDPTKSSTFKDF